MPRKPEMSLEAKRRAERMVEDQLRRVHLVLDEDPAAASEELNRLVRPVERIHTRTAR